MATFAEFIGLRGNSLPALILASGTYKLTVATPPGGTAKFQTSADAVAWSDLVPGGPGINCADMPVSIAENNTYVRFALSGVGSGTGYLKLWQ